MAYIQVIFFPYFVVKILVEHDHCESAALKYCLLWVISIMLKKVVQRSKSEHEILHVSTLMHYCLLFDTECQKNFATVSFWAHEFLGVKVLLSDQLH